MNTINISIILVALLICIYIAVMIFRKQPLFSKVNNIIMEGEIKGSNKRIFALLCTVMIVLLLSTLLIVETKELTVVQTVNVSSEETQTIKININEASVKELMLLRGIGLNKALDIEAYRNKAKFKRISELINVVGETTYNEIKGNVILKEDE